MLDIINNPSVADTVTQLHQCRIKMTLKYLNWCHVNDDVPLYLLRGPMIHIVMWLAAKPFQYVGSFFF